MHKLSKISFVKTFRMYTSPTTPLLLSRLSSNNSWAFPYPGTPVFTTSYFGKLAGDPLLSLFSNWVEKSASSRTFSPKVNESPSTMIRFVPSVRGRSSLFRMPSELIVIVCLNKLWGGLMM